MPKRPASKRTWGTFSPTYWLWGRALSVALLASSLSMFGGDVAIAQSTHPSSPCLRTVAQRADEPSSQSDILQAITSAQVVYLAETHTDLADHVAQMEIVQTLDEQGSIAIALEMFQRPFQPALDAYLAGTLTEAALIAESEYDTRWGFGWEFYAPILRYAKANQIPLIALNTPAEVTRQVAEEGLESLTGNALEYIPPIADINTDDPAYRDWIGEIFSSHSGMGHSIDFDNFFAAQVLWDETMADGIAQQLATDPKRQVIVLVGEAHVAYGYGIPSRVKRRIPEVVQVSVQLVAEDEEIEREVADFNWITSSSE